MSGIKIVFLIDVDNTLLDNDHIKEEIKKSLINVLGEKEENHFWHHHDEFRKYEKLVDFPRIIRQYCSEKHQDRCELVFNQIFDQIEFTHALYPDVKKVIAHLRTLGKVYLFTEGDMVYQKMKIEKSGLSALVDKVFLFEHKLDHLSEVIEQFRNSKVVFIDDRAASLIAIKKQYQAAYGIEIRQGHYSTVDHVEHVKVDKTVDGIIDLLKIKQEDFAK